MNWKKRKLSDLCSITKGKIGITKAIPGKYPLVATSEERRSHNEYHFEGEAVLIPLVSSTGHGHRSLNRIHYQTGKFAVGSILCAVMPKDNTILNAEYLYRYLYLNKEKELVSRMRGMANVSLPMREIGKVEIPLPPLEKQLEFVEEYKKLEAVNGELSTELSHQLSLVTQLRQAFLREAMQGKLVEQNPADEPASELLARIKAEKEQLIKEKKIRKQKPLPPIEEEEIPFETPESWEWCRLGDLSEVKGGKRIPKGHSFSNEITDHIYIRVADMKKNTISTQNIKYISKDTFKLIEKYTISSSNLYITIAGTIGSVGDVPKSFNGMNLTENAAKFVFSNKKTNKNWLLYYLMSEAAQVQFMNQKKTITAQPKLALFRISNCIVPLPPLADQNRIVAKLNELMTYCDQLEESIKDSQTQNEMLLEQVLREALEAEG